MDLRRFYLVVRQQFWLALGISLACFVCFLLLPKLGAVPVYVSTAKVLLTPNQNANRLEGRYDTGNWLANEQTLQELVCSERLLSRVAGALNIKADWQGLRERISLQNLSGSYGQQVNLFAIIVKADSSQQSQKLGKAVVDEFISYVEDLSAREYANTRKFLEELVAEAKEKVDETEEKLLSITSSRAESTQSELTMQTLNDLDTERRKVKGEIADLEAQVSSLQDYLGGRSTVLPNIAREARGPALDELDKSVSSARLKALELEQLYTDSNVQVREQRAKVASLQEDYSTEATAAAKSVSDVNARILDQKRESLRSLNNRILDIQNKQLTPTEKRQVAKLERELQLWEENHLSLVKQLYQARVIEQSSRRQGAITVLESPALGEVSREKKTRGLGAQMALAIPFSIGFGVCVVLGLDLLGSSLRLVPKIEANLGVPVLSVIPIVDEELQAKWESFKREDTLPAEVEPLLDPGELDTLKRLGHL